MGRIAGAYIGYAELVGSTNVFFSHKIYNEYQYRVVKKMCGSKIKEWKILNCF